MTDRDEAGQQVSARGHQHQGNHISENTQVILGDIHGDLYNNNQESALSLLPVASDAPFNSYSNRHSPICLPNTRVAVLQEITSWADGQDRRCIFWLNGIPGTGKSTIARTIARNYHARERLGASFFFSRGGGDVSHAGKFFTSIAWQLAEQSAILKDHIINAIKADRNHNIGSKGLHDQWTQLIVQPLLKLEGSFQSLLVIVDALDECDEDIDIRTILRCLAELNSQNTTRLRIFITSRPELPIRLGFREMMDILHHDLVLHDIPRRIVDQDIFVYFMEKFGEIRNDSEYLSADWPGEESINFLVQRAEGLFIFAATVCRFVERNNQWPPEALLKVLLPSNGLDSHQSYTWGHDVPFKSPTLELDEMYTKILQHSFKGIVDDRDELAELFRKVIGSLAILSEPLSEVVLARLLGLPQPLVNLRIKNLHSVLSIPKEEGAPIRLLHPSFRDFLLDKQRCRDQTFWVDERQRHIGR